MYHLDILIGFFLIMLVFASGVSVAQSVVKRIFSLKGAALVRPLLSELESLWRAHADSDTHRGIWEQAMARLKRDLTSWRSGISRQLIYTSLKDKDEFIALLRQWGRDVLQAVAPAQHDAPGPEGGAAPLAAEWDRMLTRLEQQWDETAARLNASYERHTRFYVYLLSLGVAVLFHVDAIRIVRVLSAQPDTRRELAQLAEERSAARPQPELGDARALTQWQKDNLADLRSAGLPLGWETTPLRICGDGASRSVALLKQGCAAGSRTDWGETFLIWLARVLGLLVSAGLIAQGAPFWYSLLDEVLRSRGAGKPSLPKVLR
jgi:hypothetical protein